MTENDEQAEKSVEAIDQNLVGISGWLVLPAIGFVTGLIFFPIMLIVSLVKYSEVAGAGHGSIHAIESILIFGLLCFMIYAATLFFRKKRNAPGTIIILFIVGYVIGFLFYVIESNAGIVSVNTLFWCFKGIYKGPIFIPYFLVSKRVKATFVN